MCIPYCLVMNTFYSFPTIAQKLFGDDTELFSSVNELFEMEMANLEYAILPQEQLIKRSAFFKMISGQPTKHFLLYAHQAQVISENRSAKTKSYFEDSQFSTGYATHSLFPYRGKFHPQLIKGLLNILGIQEGETILDPMCGSGTTNIEAALMGIHSFAVDISPFCQFMTQTKFEALTLQKNLIEHLQGKAESLFHFFHVDNIAEQFKKIDDPEKLKVYHLALLAFLDAMGYSKRVTTSTHQQLFEKVLARYIGTVKNFLENPHFSQHDIGNVVILSNSNALQIELGDNTVDGVITSPPYSFAIDYAKNDESQLQYFGYNISTLRSHMIGLIGKNKQERLNNYFRDMAIVCGEIYRVLKPGKYFVMIIGSNTNQTGGIRLEQTIIDECKKLGMPLVKSILKPIKGMRNTMKDEYVLFFQKVTP
ncbi:putative RNA methylase [Candidatus Vecturithrix granuli]|uniref:site-specific DNA-methyltransferase (cytosine-N(4)-specific) n=1 Tax=Vecturithrix granuli TaxID=1499967 RepID=A0A081C177_VECG1|nr:putative RNA methylase [Candidatus Vecturithrix granuli]